MIWAWPSSVPACFTFSLWTMVAKYCNFKSHFLPWSKHSLTFFFFFYLIINHLSEVLFITHWIMWTLQFIIRLKAKYIDSDKLWMYLQHSIWILCNMWYDSETLYYKPALIETSPTSAQNCKTKLHWKILETPLTLVMKFS